MWQIINQPRRSMASKITFTIWDSERKITFRLNQYKIFAEQCILNMLQLAAVEICRDVVFTWKKTIMNIMCFYPPHAHCNTFGWRDSLLVRGTGSFHDIQCRPHFVIVLNLFSSQMDTRLGNGSFWWRHDDNMCTSDRCCVTRQQWTADVLSRRLTSMFSHGMWNQANGFVAYTGIFGFRKWKQP